MREDPVILLPSGVTVERNVPLAPLTSWLVGGRADFLAQPKSLDQLKESLAWASANSQSVTVLGGGTNVLISDKGVRGLTVALRNFTGTEVEEHGGRLHIACLAGTSKSEVLRHFLKARLEPALLLAGLPGDVGGGIVMNAGLGEMIRPREFVEMTDWIEVLRFDLSVDRIEASQLSWNYRHCEGWQPGIVVRVGLSWPLAPMADVLERVKAANRIRLSKQPLDLPSCGSVFVNPADDKAGRLIEAAGLKGLSIGGARVSEKHANFIVNFASAKAADVDLLIRHVRETVRNRSGVELRTEVVYLGDW